MNVAPLKIPSAKNCGAGGEAHHSKPSAETARPTRSSVTPMRAEPVRSDAPCRRSIRARSRRRWHGVDRGDHGLGKKNTPFVKPMQCRQKAAELVDAAVAQLEHIDAGGDMRCPVSTTALHRAPNSQLRTIASQELDVGARWPCRKAIVITANGAALGQFDHVVLARRTRWQRSDGASLMARAAHHEAARRGSRRRSAPEFRSVDAAARAATAPEARR